MTTQAFETLSDIAATISLLIKFGQDEIIENKPLFISFLNELKFKYNGRKITSDRLFEMTQDITIQEQKLLIEQFNVGHEPIYRKLAMFNVL